VRAAASPAGIFFVSIERCFVRHHSVLVVVLSLVVSGCSGNSEDATRKAIEADIKARGLDKDPNGASGAYAATDFKTYNSPDGFFRVNFPAEPSVSTQGADTAQGTTGSASYLIIKCDYPKNDVDEKNGKMFIESFELLKD
jgi:hypothetical protein